MELLEPFPSSCKASILGILSRCDMKRRTFTDFSAPSSDARILVLTHTEYEAISAGLTPGLALPTRRRELSLRILQMLLQQQLQEHVLMPDSVEQMTSALPRAEALVIVLHNGILYDPVFAGPSMLRCRGKLEKYDNCMIIVAAKRSQMAHLSADPAEACLNLP